MKSTNFKILPFVLALVLALGLFLGGYQIYGKSVIEKPIKEQLTQLSGVTAVSLDKRDGKYLVRIKLDRVENIQKTYAQVEKVVESKLPDKKFALEIEDNRSPELDEIYQTLQPAIYEALANNHYIWLEETMAGKLEKTTFSYRLLVDDKFLYIQLDDGKSCLYELINRNDTNDAEYQGDKR